MKTYLCTVGILLVCALTRVTAQLNLDTTLIHDGKLRRYVVHLPPAYTPSVELPVVVFLHGGSGDRMSAQSFTRFNQVANAVGFIAVYPEGFGGTSVGGFSWADGRGTEADAMGVNDVGFVDALIDSLSQAFSITTERVYLCGFSNGGFMTQRVACQNNTRFAAMATLGATQDSSLNRSCTPGRPIPMLILHGSVDPFVPEGGGYMSVGGIPLGVIGAQALADFWAANNGCTSTVGPTALPDTNLSDNSSVVVSLASNCVNGSQVAYYRILGGGHTWPGVELLQYEVIAGETNEDIQAAVELWNFFSNYTRSGSATANEAPTASFVPQVYPVPAVNFTRVVSESELASVTLVSAMGQTVASVLQPGRDYTLDLSGVPCGLYFVRVISTRGAVYHKALPVLR